MIQDNSIKYANDSINARFGLCPPENRVLIDTGDGNAYITAHFETDEAFRDRVERSIACGRNLFIDECPLFVIDENCFH